MAWNKQQKKEYAHGYYMKHRNEALTAAKENRENNLPRYFRKQREWKEALKVEVFTHYGDGRLCCLWEGCTVDDPDMLTLDHIKDNGAEHRRKMGTASAGTGFYSKLRKAGFPQGYQTLCWNHQWKKQIAKKRKGSLAYRG